MILDAWRKGVSDIHVEPRGPKKETLVRFRVDGDCFEYERVPSSIRAALVARLKIMAQLDIAERRKPQDGKMLVQVGDREVELRVATIPTAGGNEDMVLRLLAPNATFRLESLGMTERNQAELRTIASRPYGLILCVGPTGSGKTTTLAGRPPEEIARLRIGLVPQGRRIFSNLTVLENIRIGGRLPMDGTRGAAARAWTLDRIFATFPKLRPLKDARGGNLSGGELQMLAIARALMGNVDLLLLDEPFEGLAPAVVEDVWKVFREIRGQTTVLLVEQNADLALGLSDRAYVINNGSIAWRGDARALQADPGLRQRLLGV
jgi:ABC-type branched-subunit amino acid transport system ATPase component